MKTYIVCMREVWIQGVEVEAESEEEAKELVAEGDGAVLGNLLEYSHTLSDDLWTVEEVNDQCQ